MRTFYWKCVMFGKKISYTDKNKLFNAQFTVFACSCVAFNGFLTFVTRKNRHFSGVQAVVFVTTIDALPKA